MVAHVSVVNSKPKVELGSHVNTFAVGNNCLVIHDHNRLANVYSYDTNNCHKSVKTVDASVGYQDPHSGLTFMLVINQTIHIEGLVIHLLCPIQCHLN